MCTPNVNALQDFNVNSTRNTNMFQLHYPDLLAACGDTGPLPYCLIPPSSRLQSMCAPTLNTYFTNVLTNREGLTLNDMPIVWDSLRESSDSEWIDIPSSSQLVDGDGTYYGLQPLPDFMSIAASGASRMLFGVANGICFKTSASSGFMEPQESVTGTNDTYQRVIVNRNGDRGCVLFYNVFYFWQSDAFVPRQAPTTTVYHWASLQEMGDVVRVMVLARENSTTCIFTTFESQSATDTFVPISSASLTLSGPSDFVSWSCRSQRLGFLVAIGTIGQTNYRVFAAQQTNFVQLWQNVPWPDGIAYEAGAWDAVCRETQTQVIVTAVNKMQQRAQMVMLDKNSSQGGFANFVQGNVMSIQESLDQTFFAFVSSEQTMYVCGPNDAIASPIPVTGFARLEWQSSLSFAGDSQKLWYVSPKSSGSVLYSNKIENQVFDPNFVSDFELKLALDMHISDFGLPTIVVRPRTTWFFGIRIVDRAQRGIDYYSPHQYYRIVINPTVVASDSQFPHVTTQLQRANFQSLARNNQLKLFNNSQTQILQGDSVKLSRNTANTWGEATDDSFNLVAYEGQDTRAISPNGLYIFYNPPQETGLGPRVVMNIFNSSAFAVFCSSKERLSKAIEQQSLFCWQHLVVDDSEFVDPRCTCIAGKRLIDALYPSLAQDDKPWNTSLARINQNFPCLSQTCQRAIAQPELTNVYNTTQDKCQNADLTLCTSTIAVLNSTSSVSIRIGSIVQDCNSAVGLQCSQDEACPLGSVCVNGRCTANCRTNQECAPGSTCFNGVCLFPDAARSDTQASSANRRVAQWILVSLGIVVFILVIFFIVLMVRRKK